VLARALLTTKTFGSFPRELSPIEPALSDLGSSSGGNFDAIAITQQRY